jgi:hypothetical protein
LLQHSEAPAVLLLVWLPRLLQQLGVGQPRLGWPQLALQHSLLLGERAEEAAQAQQLSQRQAAQSLPSLQLAALPRRAALPPVQAEAAALALASAAARRPKQRYCMTFLFGLEPVLAVLLLPAATPWLLRQAAAA